MPYGYERTFTVGAAISRPMGGSFVIGGRLIAAPTLGGMFTASAALLCLRPRRGWDGERMTCRGTAEKEAPAFGIRALCYVNRLRMGGDSELKMDKIQ